MICLAIEVVSPVMFDVVGIIFAILVAAGGAYGYFKAGSVPSLIAGLAFGILLGIGAYFNSTDSPIPLIQIIVLVVLGAMMGFRWARSGKFMPSGLLTILSVTVLVWTCVAYRDYLPSVSRTVAVDGNTNRSENNTMLT
ncbi:transmembrane protein 14 homolog isoform X2 [Toxorhynchites rutilus septentrionalis]|uniref:transmembrane protein 14 homolog isoform X2 n=1 Tax=Toxorhynchites rutilus septentrionalis TaxID=329112 RepID=UPI00247A8AE8|nr:transmembrane protein 14 homolog isoform X2 [Toxorhynchites rutilus septentrionalis]